MVKDGLKFSSLLQLPYYGITVLAADKDTEVNHSRKINERNFD